MRTGDPSLIIGALDCAIQSLSHLAEVTAILFSDALRLTAMQIRGVESFGAINLKQASISRHMHINSTGCLPYTLLQVARIVAVCPESVRPEL